MASTAIFLPPTPPLLNVANVWFSPAKDLRGGLKNDEESPCAGAWWLSLSVYTSKEWDSWNCQAGTRFLSILEQSVWAEDPSLLPPLLFQPPEEQDIFLSIKNCYLFLHRICWDQEEAKGTRSVEIRNWGRWRSRGCRGIFHSVLKIMIMGIWFTYNTIKLCKFLFLSFKTVVPPKSRGDFPNLEILRFFFGSPCMREFQTFKTLRN